MIFPSQSLNKFLFLSLLFDTSNVKSVHAFNSISTVSSSQFSVGKDNLCIVSSTLNNKVDSTEMEALPREPIAMRKTRELWQNIDEEYPQYVQTDLKNEQEEEHSPDDSKIPKDIPRLSDILSSARMNSEEQSLAASNKKKEKARKPSNDENSNSKLHGEMNLNEPWKADYVQSRKTQKKLRAAAFFNEEKFSGQRKLKQSFNATNENTKKSIRILSVLLNETPPNECNEVNVLYALSLSAKITPMLNPDDVDMDLQHEFRSKLLCTLDVVAQLVADKRLSGRQLTNAAWATMRHYTTNSNLFHQQMDDESSKKSTSEFIETLLDFIALQLIDLIQEEHTFTASSSSSMTENGRTSFKPAELSMASWAYAMLRPRNCPAGWSFPAKEARIPIYNLEQKSRPTKIQLQKRNNIQKEKDEIIFEEASDYISFSPKKQTTEINELSTTDLLFDSIANLFSTSDSFLSQEPTLLQQCRWKELSNLAWSFASHGSVRNKSEHVESFLSALALEATNRLKILDSNMAQDHEIQQPLHRDISMLAWSFGVMQVDNYRLSTPFGELIDAISSYYLPARYALSDDLYAHQFSDWKSADILQLAISLAHGRIDQKKLLHALFTEAQNKLESNNESFQSWELSVLLWVQAKLNLTSNQGDIYNKFAEIAVTTLAERLKMADTNNIAFDESSLNGSKIDISIIGVGPQEQANLAWSLTVLEIYNPDSIFLLQSIFSSSSSEQTDLRREFNPSIKLEHAHQLWQALFILRVDCPDSVQHVLPSFGDFLSEKWVEEKSREKISSHRHRALSQTLDFMRVKHYNEHEEDIDIALVLNGPKTKWTHDTEKYGNVDNTAEKYSNPKVAVEFDGPTHFTRLDNTGPPRALGHTVMKYRMLKIKGWTVVRVPYYEFDKIPFWASMERQRYLQRALKTHANIKFSEIDVSEYKPQVHNRKSRFD